MGGDTYGTPTRCAHCSCYSLMPFAKPATKRAELTEFAEPIKALRTACAAFPPCQRLALIPFMCRSFEFVGSCRCSASRLLINTKKLFAVVL